MYEPRLPTNLALGALRFVPKNDTELYSSIFTLWNILDRQMFHYDAKYNYQTGYTRELQLRRMVDLVREDHVNTYCEIGMNGGHSVSAMLEANPKITVHVFDTMQFNYSHPIANILSVQWRPIPYLQGQITNTIRPWHNKNECVAFDI